jgi:hypothetical protein
MDVVTHMRASPPLVTAASAALVFAVWPLAAASGAEIASKLTIFVPGVVAPVGLAILLAISVSGGASAVAVAYGAFGALAAGLLAPGHEQANDLASVSAGSVLLAAAYAERTGRVRGRGSKLLHLATAAVAGGIAAGVVASFAHAHVGVRAVAIVVAAVVATIPHIVAADDLVASSLDAASREVDEPAKGALAAGADLRRNADDALLDRATSRTVRRTWRALVRLAESRLRVHRSRAARAVPGRGVADVVLTMLDTRIAEHVAAIARAYSAVDTARAAELGLDDAALRTTQSAGEALEHVSSAIVDVQP